MPLSILTSEGSNRLPMKCTSLIIRHIHAAIALLPVALVVQSVHAQPNFEQEFDDVEKPWQEVALLMPAPPKPENLLPYAASATTTYRFAIDAKSLSVGKDGVVRYTLVGTSDSGAQNISYEGIRCESFEKKLYAFGRPDGSWARSKRDQWERIPRHIANNQHAALAIDYFCQNRTVAGTADDMLERLRRQQPLTSRNYN